MPGGLALLLSLLDMMLIYIFNRRSSNFDFFKLEVEVQFDDGYHLMYEIYDFVKKVF